jgi:hypothetical protein
MLHMICRPVNVVLSVILREMLAIDSNNFTPAASAMFVSRVIKEAILQCCVLPAEVYGLADPVWKTSRSRLAAELLRYIAAHAVLLAALRRRVMALAECCSEHLAASQLLQIDSYPC